MYSGGGVSALSRQASANSAKAQDELDATRQEVITGTTREFRGVQSGALRIRALEKAVVSNERSLLSTRKGFKEGDQHQLRCAQCRGTVVRGQA